MDRYADLDLDCEDGGLAQKATLFGGLFKKSSKSAGPVARAQDSTQDSSSVGGGRSESSDGPTDGSKKSAVFGGLLKRSPKAGHVRRPSQDLLDTEFTASDDSLSESATAKEKRAAFKGMFKASKPFGARTRSQEELSAPSEASSSNDSLSVNSNTKKDEEDTETLEKNEKKGEENPKPETKTMSTHATVRAGEAVDNQNQPQDKGLKEEDEGKLPESKSAKSDDEGLEEEEDASSKEEKEEEDGQDKTETQVKKPKRPNPFMPRAKGRVVHRSALEAAAESDGGNRSLFDRLEDFRVDPSQPEDRQDVENLMEWWNQVDSWKDTAQDDDMTEKEEAKAFAVTAEKVQKGIRVFNKLFSERAESLWQHVIDLNSIADGLDKFNKNTKIAQITGGSTSALGGVATITGLALAPVTFGVSLIVTAVGLGVATAGGLTSAGAGISNQVNNSMDRKKVEKIVQDYQEKMVDLDKCLKFIKQGIEDLKRFDLIKMKKRAYNRDFPALSSSFYEDGAMAGKAILSNANEIMRVVQIANAAGSTAARAVQIASMATGVLTGLFVGMDIYFVAKDSKELKKGAKSEFAAKIREVATELHDGLVELNGIRGELQSTSPEGRRGGPAAPETEDEGDESSEDEIDRIKRAIKKDYENREYV